MKIIFPNLSRFFNGGKFESTTKDGQANKKPRPKDRFDSRTNAMNDGVFSLFVGLKARTCVSSSYKCLELEFRRKGFSMAPVLSRSLATASLASLPSTSSFLLRNSNTNRVLNLTTAFVPQNGLRKHFSSSGLKWKYERRNHQFALRCEAAAVAEKEAADTPGENFEYQAKVRLFSIFPFNFVYPLCLFLTE
ncbi:hypothetical protein ACB092_11G033100 [Castanea dentata]